MSELSEALGELLAEHRRIGSPVPDYLIPGHPEREVRAHFAGLGLDPSDEVVEYFTLLDNVDDRRWIVSGRPPGTHSFLWLYPPYEMPRLDGVAMINGQARSIIERFGTSDGAYWGDSWATVLFTDRSSLAADCRGGPTSVVWYQSFHPSNHPTAPIYPSVSAMLRDGAARLRSGAVSWTPEGFDWDWRSSELFPSASVIERAQQIAGFHPDPDAER